MSAIANLKLRALMELRLAHPDASLEELAELLSEELASSVSKSNVNHLFRSLHNLYLEEGGDAA
jgi:DNA-binding protein WhiA